MQSVNSFLEHKTAMETYYIRKQLPEMATLPKPDPLIKNFDFYKDDNNIWNRTARTSKKVYQFYHKYNDENQKKIDHRQDLNIFDKIKLQEQKKKRLLSEKEEGKSRLLTRKLERKVLQFESHQRLDQFCDEDKDFQKTLNNRVLADYLLNKNIHLSMNGKVPNLWNDLTKSSMKSIRMECTISVIHKDEEAIQAIQNKIYKDQELERVKKEVFREARDKIRGKFLKKHDDNFEFQRKVGLVQEEPSLNNELFKTKYNMSLKSMNPNHQNNQSHLLYLEKLSQPKGAYIPENLVNTYSDFQGLYGATINDRTATKNNLCFVKTMMENSIVAQENVRKLKDSRPCSRETRPTTAFSTMKKPMSANLGNKLAEIEALNQNYEDLFLKKDTILREMDDFHKRFGGLRKVGYPKIELTSRFQDKF